MRWTRSVAGGRGAAALFVGCAVGFLTVNGAYVFAQHVPDWAVPVNAAREAAARLSDLLGFDGERVYLVLLQDSGELRPTGGFIGNYGIVRIARGRIVEHRFRDTYQLDLAYRDSMRAPPTASLFKRYLPEAGFWGLRDSNISPDFPTSAKVAAQLALTEGAADRIDGVIAVTGLFGGRVLQAVGPVQVPELGESISADNYDERLRYYQLGEGQAVLTERFGPSGQSRKAFTALFLEAVTARVLRADPATFPALVEALANSARAKDLQIYLDDPSIEAVVKLVGLGGDLQDPIGDYLNVVDMNLSAGKDNLYVRQAIDYRVGERVGEGVLVDLGITYDYTRTGNRYPGTIIRPYYGDYVRVYAPAGSTLIYSEGSVDRFVSDNEKGKTVFSGFVQVDVGQSKVVHLRYVNPSRCLSLDGKTASYRLLVQRQPGSNVAELRTDVDPAIRNAPPSESGTSYVGPLDRDLEFEWPCVAA